MPSWLWILLIIFEFEEYFSVLSIISLFEENLLQIF